MPRWLWVATGTLSKTREISSSVKPCSRSRSSERSITSSWAHGQAVMPWASTPTSRRVPPPPRGAPPAPGGAGPGVPPRAPPPTGRARPRLGRHRRAVQRVDLLGGRAGDRSHLVLRVARRDRGLGAQAALAVAHALGD